MAILADVGGLHVRRTLARCVRTVVAAEAAVDDICMIKVCRRPRYGRMTIVAIVAAGDVRRVFAGRSHAIVAGTARANHLRVVDQVRRYPGVRRMAILADVGRLDMRWRLASGVDAVVAVETVAGNVDVVEVGRQPGYGGMAVVAIIAALDMIRILARCNNAIVTAAATTDDLCVIHGVSGREQVCRVTVLADVGRLDVGRVLAGCIDAVVAVETVAGDIDMIKVGRQPGYRRMAVIAVIAAGNVCRVLAGRRYAVVAGPAGTENLCMVHSNRRHPDAGVVAILTDIRRLDVRCGLACRGNAVVAADTVVGNTHVIEVRRPPRDGGMAVIARIAAGNMCRVLAGGCDAVVARITGTDYLCVINRVCRREQVRVVTILADITRLDMGRIFAGCLDAIVTIEAGSGDVYMVKIRR